MREARAERSADSGAAGRRLAVTIGATTRVVGVIGWPIEHTLSPAMHNVALQEMQLDWVYLAFAVRPEDVGVAVAAVRGLGMVGLNVTIPHKQMVVEYLDEVDETARALEAVNTIVREQDRLVGYNTDGAGFLRSLEERGHSVAGKRVAIIGAGGAARAVAYAVACGGASSLSVLNRTPEKAEQVAELVRNRGGSVLVGEVEAGGLRGQWAKESVREADVVVDCTSVGMYPQVEAGPVVPAEWLRERQVVVDLTYNPLQTTMLKAGAARGAQTVDGTGMLVHQGAISLEYWSGKQPPTEKMREALLAELRSVRNGG